MWINSNQSAPHQAVTQNDGRKVKPSTGTGGDGNQPQEWFWPYVDKLLLVIPMIRFPNRSHEDGTMSIFSGYL